MARLLEEQRARATVSVQDKDGCTALHYACCDEEDDAPKVPLLLQAGADPTLYVENGEMTPLDMAMDISDRGFSYHPNSDR